MLAQICEHATEADASLEERYLCSSVIIFVEEQPITRWNRAFQQFFPTILSEAGAGE